MDSRRHDPTFTKVFFRGLAQRNGGGLTMTSSHGSQRTRPIFGSYPLLNGLAQNWWVFLCADFAIGGHSRLLLPGITPASLVLLFERCG
jgi:hypothetical protein